MLRARLNLVSDRACLASLAATRTVGGWQHASVRAALATLTLVDFGPTACRQLAECESAKRATLRPFRRLRTSAPVRWKLLVRFKVCGELLGLYLAQRAPLAGASVVLLSHLLFWAGGAAKARVDANGAPAPLPPPIASIIWKADAVVLSFALLGAAGPTPRARSVGAALFAVAGALVSLEQMPKWLKRAKKQPPAPLAVAADAEDAEPQPPTTDGDVTDGGDGGEGQGGRSSRTPAAPKMLLRLD